MNLHFVGDSHVSVFSGYNISVISYWPMRVQSVFNSNWWCYNVGPHLAFNFLKYGFPIVKEVVEKYFSSDDLLCLVWGEIDCRMWLVARAYPDPKDHPKVHVSKEVEDAFEKAVIHRNEIEQEVKTCVDTYLSGIEQILDLGMQSKNIIIIGPHLPFAESKYPETEIKLATQVFNEELRKGALIKDMKFATLFYRLSSVKMKEYYVDTLHLSSKVLPLFVEELENVCRYL